MPEERVAAVTLREIADAAGVSISSVSRALAGRGDLGRDTRERSSRPLARWTTTAGGPRAAGRPRSTRV